MKNLLIISTILFLSLAGDTFAQSESKYGTDSITCITNLSLSYEYYKQKNVADAIEPWRWVFANCPASSKRIYVNGEGMFEKFIQDEQQAEKKSKYLDTLMMIYDQRIKYYNEEGFVLGKKGLALYENAPDKKSEASEILKKSIELDGTSSGPVVLYKYFQINTELFSEKKITKEDVIDVYDQVSELLDANIDGPNGSSYDAARMNVETFFGPFATCEDLINIYAPRLAADPENPALLKKIVNLFSKKGCNDADIYMQAAESLYKIEPSSKAAFSLGRMYAGKKMNSKASSYYSEAIELESDNDKKAAMLLDFADFNMRELKNLSQAKTLALRSASLRPNWGRPWLLIGDIYFSSSTSCEDDFNGASVFWAATDKYQKAKSIDSSVAEEANKKIATNAKYYPKKEDLFFLGLKAGDSYSIKCWINETTTVRTR